MRTLFRPLLIFVLTGSLLLAGSTGAFGQTGPTIDVWYGLSQDFGVLGEAQVWCDIQGNVSDPDGVALLSYTLNGGIDVPMNQGPDGFRLQNTGDFIVDLAVADLVSGANTVVITAEDALGNPNTAVVTVNYIPGNTWPATYSTDWGSLVTDGNPLTPDPAILEQATVVNGNWSVVGDSIRTVEPGFDRLVAIGDIAWTDYEVTVPVTMNEATNPGAFGVGFKFRWQGHTDNPDNCDQPLCGYLPLGELGWIFQDKLDLFFDGPDVPFIPTLGTTYWMKMRVETDMSGATYSLKAWENGQAEPDWMVTHTDVANSPAAGSLMLVAHEVDASFGNVTVIPVTGTNTPPVAVDDAAFVVTGTSKDVDVLFNDYDPDGFLDPATVTVTSGPFNGSISGIAPGTGVVTYLHDGGVATADSFTYTVDDNEGAVSNEATVRLSIGAPPTLGFYSDDFNTCGLADFWTYVDPTGSATPPAIEGAFTGDAHLSLSVPGGTEAQPYGGIIGAPHITQLATDEDFTLEVKWDSAHPSIANAEQGILIIQDDGKWLRFDIASFDSDIHILAIDSENAIPVNFNIGSAGTTPQYIRVNRAGDTWNLHYSFDGSSWFIPTGSGFTYALAVAKIGLFTGTAGANPAHTALVDYFSNTADPVDGSDDTDLNVPDVTIVGNGAVTLDPDLANFACGDPVQLTALADPGSVFTGWSGDVDSAANPLDLVMNGPISVTATFRALAGNVVAANTSGVLGLSPSQPCAAGIPIEITRDGAAGMRGFSLTLQLTDLDLCSGLVSIQEGPYLSNIGTTQFDVTDNGGGNYQIDGTILGVPCGAVAPSGILFTIDVTHTIADGTGLISVSGLSLFDCASQVLGGDPGADAPIQIDSTPPANVTGLATTQLLSSPSWSTRIIKVDISWTPSLSPDAYQIDLYRVSFGGYPEYDDAGGSAPTLPTDPAGEGWQLINTKAADETSHIAQPADRDYYYFCVVTRDSLGNESAVGAMSGIPNYLLGDVSDGGASIVDGDNIVDTADLTLLGSGYGTMDGDAPYRGTLDIGPTSDMSVSGLPTTDNKIDFEDLILFSLNYSLDASGNLVSPPVQKTLPPAAASNVLSATHGELPAVGETFDVHLVLAADGSLQALQIPLEWDYLVVEPVSVRGGPLLAAQGGQAFLMSPEPGTVDLALAGARETGISGTGEVASVIFRVIGLGSPGIEPGDLTGRNRDNESVEVSIGDVTEIPGGLMPAVTRLRPNYPNPFNPTTTISFDLVSQGRVNLAVYGIDGRLVRIIADEVYSAGRHEKVWDGRDAAGRSVASGTYLYIMQTGDIRQTRRMLLLK